MRRGSPGHVFQGTNPLVLRLAAHFRVFLSVVADVSHNLGGLRIVDGVRAYDGRRWSLDVDLFVAEFRESVQTR